MAVTNTDDKAVDDSKEVTEEDLKKLKEDSKVEPEKADEIQSTEESDEESEETDTEEETEEESQDESDEDSSEFVKEFPNIKGDTPEEYARNLEIAYQNSTAEALRQKALAEAKPEVTEVGEDSEETGPIDPRLLYLDQMLQKDITDSFNTFSKQFPQTKDPEEYAKFQTEASNLSQYIITTQKRVAPASELYSKVAAILGWQPEVQTADNQDKLKVALKDSASSSKTTSATKPKTTSKITDAQVSIAKQMGGWTDGKSDAEIRKELEIVT